MVPIKLQKWKEKDTLLGSGGFGNVRLFFNENGEYLVVKECKPKTMTEKMKERWKNECEIMLKLDHPHIVKSVPLPEELKQLNDLTNPVLPMEYCNSGDLRKVLNLPQNIYGLEEYQVRAVVHDISSAIQYLHEQRIYHRDLKPENIVLHHLARQRVVYKIIDLGYAKEVSQDSICTSFVGTIQYLAPELLSNTKPEYTGTVDYWSLGTTVFECICGFRPFMQFSEIFQWLQVVRSKSDRDIYACNNPSNQQTLFYEHLPRTSRLASVSQNYFEAWLRLMLTYDPKKRGGLKQGKGPDCYECLQDLFNHKPLHVYDPLTNESHFYDVIGNESLYSIGHLAMTFQNIPRDQITFITMIGSVPNTDSLLKDYCSPVNYELEQELDEIDINLILAYPTIELPEKKKQKGPKLDHLMSGQPVSNMHDQLKLCKQLVNYCWRLYRSFQHLRKSTEGIKLCLLREEESFAELIASLKEASKVLQSKFELFCKSHETDIDELKKLKSTSDENACLLLRSWQSQDKKIQEWKNLINQEESLVMKYNSVQYKIIKCLKGPHAEHCSDKESKMRFHTTTALELVDLVRESSSTNLNCDKTADIRNCLQDCERDWGQFSKENRSQIRTIMGLYKEVMHFKHPISELVTKLRSSSDELTAFQINRQREIWKNIKEHEITNLSPGNTPGYTDVRELCDKSRLLMERAKSILSEKLPSIVEYDWSFLDQ